MAANYKWGEIRIMRASNGIMGTLYNSIMDVLEQEQLELDACVQLVVNKLELGQYGFGINFADYIKTKSQMAEFIQLLEKAIYQYYIEVPLLCDEVKELLWNFHNELVKCGESLPD